MFLLGLAITTHAIAFDDLLDLVERGLVHNGFVPPIIDHIVPYQLPRIRGVCKNTYKGWLGEQITTMFLATSRFVRRSPVAVRIQPGGTGKTAFAQHIAETTGRELLVKRASDILSPFVGMTERNIAEAFEEAAETGSILLIDEADSLLIDRRYARQSWETTQTNELLCQMESYPGMLICCTNLLDKLDPAVLRRFSWKVEFRELSLPARRKICVRYFPSITDWDQAGELSCLRGLTPGDVKAVWQRSRTIGESYTTASDVIAALAQELRYKAPKSDDIGFRS